MRFDKLIYGFSKFMDTATYDTMHQRRTAYIAANIAIRMGLPDEAVALLLEGALLHDVALFSDKQKEENFLQIVKEEYKSLTSHATKGYRVARYLNAHLEVSHAIGMHHTPSDRNHSILGSLLFLSDNVEVAFRALTNPFAFSEIPEFLKQKKNLFDTEMFETFESLSSEEAFWYGMFRECLDTNIKKLLNRYFSQEANEELFKRIAYLVAYRIDSLSIYTENYSVLAKNIAMAIGYMLSLDTELLRLAALFSHLGYAFLPVELLIKPDKLDGVEVNMIRMHPYHAGCLLEEMGAKRELLECVIGHHISDGYPYGRERKTALSEVLSAATVCAALLQDRPYRAAFSQDEAKKMILQMDFSEPIKNAIEAIDLEKAKSSEDEYYEGVRRLFL